MGAANLLLNRGQRIPDDLSIAGFGNFLASEYFRIPLTTIRQPLDQIAGRAFDLLMALLDGQQPDSTRVTLPPELIVRESTRRMS